ncbi:glycoside hydrolase family 30 beta sandwich domain-containing protein [uncultured Paludibaculum sp.]|uniref:glycoside hydrolase family 30 protein n=1 Tax=uncultured Paludibaculum sp. TaxID=1765020 RepID=UPI002AAB3866|nr:glycoside hydrolase family 30 beta sandwich domain-containing protein [uncultured Paludibaculum sp.]
MSKRMTRREWAGWTAAGLTAFTPAVPAWAQPAGTIVVRQTAGTKRFAEEAALKWQPALGNTAGSVVLDPSRTYQEMLGFGGALTDASAYMINQLDPTTREKLLRELYDPAELGMTVTRICVGASDYATHMYSYDEGEPDPELKRFSIEPDKAYILPQLRAARKYNPSLYLLASPWSPPGWMKANGTMLGGSLKPKNFPVYAQYLVKFLEGYQAEGVPVDAITSQNETDTDQDGRMPACLWAQEHEIVFVSQHLGPALEQKKIPTKIWILDHNFNLWGRVINELENPMVSRYVDGVAWHPYVGSVTAANRVHDLFPDKGMYSTEGNFDATFSIVGPMTFGAGAPGGAGPEPGAAAAESRPHRDRMSAEAIARAGVGAANSVRNWMKCIIVWNLVLDENGKPNIGPFNGPGFLTIDSRTKEITRSGAYWAMKHYTHAARRGSKRFDSQGGAEGIAHVAFTNPDGTKAVVLSNVGAARTIRLQLGGLMTEVMLPAHSVTNLSWT